MNKAVSIFCLAITFVAGAVYADDVSISLVEGHGQKRSVHRATTGGLTTLRLSVSNLSSEPIVVSYIGAGSSAFLAKVEDRKIEPASEAFFPVLIDNDVLGIGENVEIAIGYSSRKQLKTAQAVVTLSSTDVLTFTPGFLSWKVGEAPIEKQARISLPAQFKIQKLPEVAGFELRLEGTTIFAKPMATDKPTAAGAVLRTTPNLKANRLVQLGLSVVE